MGFNSEHLKANLRMAITRIGILKNKKHNGMLAKKEEIANYLRTGNEEMAKINVEGVINSENFISALEILCIMCTQCAERIRVITEFKDCPRDMLGSVHTLIYAEPYCECPELVKVKEQLKLKYGKNLVRAAERDEEGLVNSTVKAKLATCIPDMEVKIVKLEEIAAERHVEYTPSGRFIRVSAT